MIDAGRSPSQGSRAGALWMVLVLLHASMSLFLIADWRRVTERDAKRHCDRQLAALSDSARSGSFPGSLLQQVLLPVARLLEESTFLPLFHLGMFIDELIFLLGGWLLVRSLLGDPRCVFFVSVATLGWCLWTSSGAAPPPALDLSSRGAHRDLLVVGVIVLAVRRSTA
jgi:hypothetical protein